MASHEAGDEVEGPRGEGEDVGSVPGVVEEPHVGGSGWGCGLVLGLLVGLILGLVLALKGPELVSGWMPQAVPEASETSGWHCPMHPTVTSDHPGKCPLCGMDLVRIEAQEVGVKAGAAGPTEVRKGKEAAAWHCPMHPTVTSDHPGKCPLCGMDLVPLEQAVSAGARPEPAVVQLPAYACPMHPTVTSAEPGSCPLCGMALEPIPEERRAQAGQEDAGPRGVEGLAEVVLDTRRQQLIGLKLAEVDRGTVRTGILTSGRVVPDESRVRGVTLLIEGRIERLYATVGSVVQAGAPLLELFSPEWMALQQELLLARQTDALLGGPEKVPQETSLLEATKRKLLRMGIPSSDLERVLSTGQTRPSLILPAPFSGTVTKRSAKEGEWVRLGEPILELTDLSRVWVLADLFEDELARVQLGTPAVLRFKSLPEQRFEGQVRFIEPQVDPKTRAIRVRLEVPNAGGTLRPELYGEVALHSGVRESIRIPYDAVIDSGTRKVVFVSKGNGHFAPRSVSLGVSDGEFVEVKEGLDIGEQVVRRALFLIDSESRLKSVLFGQQ